MLEYEAALPPVELARTLPVAVLLPLFAALLACWSERLRSSDRRTDANQRCVAADRLRQAAIAGACVLLGIECFNLLTRASDGTQLVSHVSTLAQLGSLDLSLTFVCGTPSCCLAFAIALAGLVHARRHAGTSRPDGAAAGLAISGGLCSVLAANLVVLLIGWELIAVGVSLAVARSVDPPRWAERAQWIERIAQALLCACMLLTFWALSGSWGIDGAYVPDFKPRVVSVTSSAIPSSEHSASGTVTFLDWPGATLRFSGARLCAVGGDGSRGGLASATRSCRVAAVSPFTRIPVPLGRYDVRITPGPGTDELAIERLSIRAAEQTRLLHSGATVDFRVLREQAQLRAKAGSSTRELAAKRVAGLQLSELVAILIGLAVACKGCVVARSLRSLATVAAHRRTAVTVYGLAGVSAALVPILRLDFLVEASYLVGALAAGALSVLALGSGVSR
jgi:hypothetical protein